MKFLEKYYERTWGGKHTANSTFHTLGGIGIGFLLVEYFGIGDLTLGWILLGVSILGHIWAWVTK